MKFAARWPKGFMTARTINIEALQRAQDLQRDKKWTEAIPLWREHLEFDPQDAAVWFNLGAALQATADSPADRYAAAECYQKVLTCPGVEMDTKAHAMSNLGVMMLKVGHHAKAMICFNLATQIDPTNAAARVNLGDALRYEGKYDAADAEFEAVLKLDPESHGAKFSSGMIKLLLGDLEEGFRLYESRHFVDSFPAKLFITDVPSWNGEDLDGKTLLVTQEQGYGDTFQMVRYCAELKNQWPDCRIIFRGDAALKNIILTADGVDAFVTDASEVAYDYHVPTMSLPFRMGTTLASIPSAVPYIGTGGAGIISDEKLEAGSFNVALVWAGSPRHGRDEFRSFEPELFQPLVDAHPECSFYSLQCGPRADEVAKLRNVTDLAPIISDWTHTAQALHQLDLLITVDTAIAHLAGALSCNVWMLTPHSPDWRWLLGRSDSPWYPTMRLFRQEREGGWQGVIKQISKAL